ncbi:hypothetical protein DB346_08475 [Verrucomicrobia bacterium LW23]|nr:hypothetical protein DB346_08475 [Verrucomicrobia bacterium LW23]
MAACHGGRRANSGRPARDTKAMTCRVKPITLLRLNDLVKLAQAQSADGHVVSKGEILDALIERECVRLAK